MRARHRAHVLRGERRDPRQPLHEVERDALGAQHRRARRPVIDEHRRAATRVVPSGTSTRIVTDGSHCLNASIASAVPDMTPSRRATSVRARTSALRDRRERRHVVAAHRPRRAPPRLCARPPAWTSGNASGSRGVNARAARSATSTRGRGHSPGSSAVHRIERQRRAIAPPIATMRSMASSARSRMSGSDGDPMLHVLERAQHLGQRRHLHVRAHGAIVRRNEPLGRILAPQPVKNPDLGRDDELVGRRDRRTLDHSFGREDLHAFGITSPADTASTTLVAQPHSG